MRTRTIDHAQVKAMGAARFRPGVIAERLGCSTSYVRLILKGKVGLNRQSLSRQDLVPLAGRSAKMPAFDNPSIVKGRTLYPSTVVDPATYEHGILKSGFNSAKIGRLVTKGKWKGFPIYTLTLEERATCPLSCGHYRSCFGNSMQHAHRLSAGDALEMRLVEEVTLLGLKHRKGFAIRLHVLGDFYSVDYVNLWETLLEKVPQLHVFGFSARWDCDRDPIAGALVRLVMKRWDRFAIRFSDAPIEECSTVSVELPTQAPVGSIVCPQQVGRTKQCGTCALCWSTRKPIAFIQHAVVGFLGGIFWFVAMAANGGIA